MKSLFAPARVSRAAYFSTALAAFALLLSAASSAEAQMTVSGQFGVAESGAATYRIPIQVPPGTAGMEPKLALAYDSQGGSGLAGMGWELSGLSAITRCPRTVAQDGVQGSVNFDTNDRLCLDGQRLVLVSGGPYAYANTEYRTELDSQSRIMAYGAANGSVLHGPDFLVVQTKSGLTMEFGTTADSRIEAQGSNIVAVWALNKVKDAKGNYFTVTYSEDNANGNSVPARIDYTGNGARAPANSVQFITEPRTDVTSPMFRAGFATKSTVRLKAIRTYAGAALVKEYRQGYSPIAGRDESFLTTVAECDAQGACLPPTTFAMPTPASGFAFGRWETRAGAYSDAKWLTGDMNGDGKVDLIHIFGEGPEPLMTSVDVHLNMGSGFQIQRWKTRSGGFWPGQKWMVADVNADGKSDLVAAFADQPGGPGTPSPTSIDVLLSTGATFQHERWITQAGSFWDSQKWFITDVNGDGRSDAVVVFDDNGSTSIDAYVNTGQAFQFQRWETKAGGYWDTQKWFVADANGDGKPDMVNVFADGGFASVDVHVNTGTGFQAQRWLTRAGGFWDAQKWFVADLNGDGNTDLVNVFNDNASVSVDVLLSTGKTFQPQRWQTQSGGYWDAQRWFVADVNGDGKPDLVNVFGENGSASADVHLNKGTRFQFARWLTQVGGYWEAQQWFAMDVTGDGIDDLVNLFNESGAISIDVHKSQASVIAVNQINALGASISITYKPLTEAGYVKDPDAVYPKISLIFPQYVVAQTATSNGVGGTALSGYGYIGLKAELGAGRGMLGFREMKVTNLSTGVTTRTEYLQDWPYIGFVFRKTVLKPLDPSVCPQLNLIFRTLCWAQNEPNRQPLARITNTYSQSQTSAAGTLFPYAAQSVEESWDLNGAVLPTVTTTSQYGQVPQYGDPTQVQITSSDGSSKTTVNVYEPANTSNGNWILGRLKKATVTSYKP